MRYTGIIDAPELPRVSYIAFDTEDDGSVELRAFAEAHPGTTPVMSVGEPGDPDDSARFIVTVDEHGHIHWRAASAGAAPIEKELS